jgi:hypothetical protein
MKEENSWLTADTRVLGHSVQALAYLRTAAVAFPLYSHTQNTYLHTPR